MRTSLREQEATTCSQPICSALRTELFHAQSIDISSASLLPFPGRSARAIDRFAPTIKAKFKRKVFYLFPKMECFVEVRILCNSVQLEKWVVVGGMIRRRRIRTASILWVLLLLKMYKTLITCYIYL